MNDENIRRIHSNVNRGDIDDYDIDVLRQRLLNLNSLRNKNKSLEIKMQIAFLSEMKKLYKNKINDSEYINKLKNDYRRLKDSMPLTFDSLIQPISVEWMTPEKLVESLDSSEEKISEINSIIKALTDELKQLENQQGKGLKILASQSLTKLPIFLSQLHAGNSSKKNLKMT